jgi:phosphoribosylformylglycinamidine cyclo-ligase
MIAGDIVLGLASSGMHSNGFSLLRKVVQRAGLAWDARAPFEPSLPLSQALLKPTRIYVKSALAAIRQTKAVKALAHITGGGLTDNIPRVVPKGLGVRIDLRQVPVLPVFKWLAAAGNIAMPEMLRTFNCGIGMVAIVAQQERERVMSAFTAQGEDVVVLGELTAIASGAPRVRYDGELDLAR